MTAREATYKCRSCGNRHSVLMIFCPYTKIPREMTL